MWTEFGFLDALGVIGSLMIAGAYLAVSLGRVGPEGIRFHLINAGGSILLLVSLWFRPNAGAIMIELLWLSIAAMGLTRAFLRRR